MTSLQAHSLVANVLPFIIISKVATTKDVPGLSQDSDTSEHYMPRVPAQSGITYMYMCVCVCVHICTCITCRAHRVSKLKTSISDEMSPVDMSMLLTPALRAR